VSCLSNSEQMGEGWSDYFALMLTMKSDDQGNDKKGMATYLEGQGIDGNGIRNYPYSTDMSANPFTYEDISSVSVPHGVGSVWATMLWDMTWGLIEKYGFDGDIYNGSGGNNIAIQLVTTALKMQPCNPGFIDGRNAILAADLAIYNGANQCIIWEAFAKRGLGFGADQGLSTSVTDGISNFDLPPSCNEKLIVEKTNNREFAGIGDTVHYIISVINNQPTQVQNLVMLDTIPPHLSYISNSLTQGVIDNNVISFTQTTSDSGSIYTIEYDCKINDVIGVQTEQIETFESAVTWQSIPIIGNEVWQSTNTSSHTGSNSMLAINSNSTQIQQLFKNIFLPKNAILSFWHSYETEEKWDGGLVELSLDNGSTWIDLSSYFIMNGYPKSINNVTNVPNAGKKAFTGNSEGYHLSVINLSSFSHKDAIIRFLFGSDSSVGSIGWHIDDIYLYQSSIIENKAQVSATNAPIDSALSYSFVLPNCLECIAEYNCNENIFDLSNFDSHSYRANQNITTLGELQNGSPLILRAGQSIEFKPSFTVPLNSVLITEMENCSNDQ
jgi:extracellular elastinolytic metalloproteinase